MRISPFVRTLSACLMLASWSGGPAPSAGVPADCSSITSTNLDDCVRLNEIQMLGTHNSYHVAPARPKLAALGERGRNLDYTHRPLLAQLSELNVRQLELDVFADPTGGRFNQDQNRHVPRIRP